MTGNGLSTRAVYMPESLNGLKRQEFENFWSLQIQMGRTQQVKSFRVPMNLFKSKSLYKKVCTQKIWAYPLQFYHCIRNPQELYPMI